MKKIYTLLILLIPFVGFGQAPISHTIHASPYNSFSPSELTITIGDTVFFSNLTNHNAVEVSEDTYDNNGIESNGGFELYSDYYIVLDEVGTHYYVCTPHVQMGMKGTITVLENNTELLGQWYSSEDDEYVEIDADTIHIYEYEDDLVCYDYMSLNYQATDSTILINDSEQPFSLTYILSQTQFILFFDESDSTIFEPQSFDPSTLVLCEFESYNCTPEGCVTLSNDQGDFEFLEECEASCIEIDDSWNCVDDACTDPMDGTGVYGSLDECEAICIEIADSWNCVDNACIDPMDGAGVYGSLNECESACNVTSIIKNNLNVNIFPNPSSKIFNLNFYSESESEISVSNVLGKTVYFKSTKSVGEFNTQIDLSNYLSGIYNLTIKTFDGISNHKLILQ